MLVRLRRRREERGASLVEFALILPVFALLLFGLIEFGFVFMNWISVRQGAREGARQAVVANFGGSSSCATTGFTGPTETKELVCLTKGRSDIAGDEMRVYVDFGASGYAVGEPVKVCVARPLNSFTGLFSPFINNRVLKTKVEMRIEQLTPTPASPGGVRFGTGGETDPTGSGWSWC